MTTLQRSYVQTQFAKNAAGPTTGHYNEALLVFVVDKTVWVSYTFVASLSVGCGLWAEVNLLNFVMWTSPTDFILLSQSITSRP